MRPEFQQYIQNEQKIIDLVNDIATVLGDIAINSHHTPALYSTFLRALISARTDVPQQQQQQAQQQPQPQTELVVGDEVVGQNDMSLFGSTSTNGMNDFYLTSEMGPVADMSTFPPTMATMPTSDEGMGMLSMENIFSNGFWDNVLVPGTLMLGVSLPCG